MPTPKLRFRVPAIATVLLVLFAITLVSVLLLSVHHRFERMAAESGERLFRQLVDAGAQEIDQLMRGAQLSVDNAVQLSREFPWQPENPVTDTIEQTMRAVLKVHPALYSAYLGFAHGDFLQVINTEGMPRVIAALNAPETTSFVLRGITTPADERSETWRFFDAQGQLLSTRSAPAAFNPAVRPWFERAQNTQDTILTPAYVFASSGELGVTLAQRGGGNDAVIGVDLSLETLNELLIELTRELPGGLLILDENQRLLASRWHSAGSTEDYQSAAPLTLLAESSHPLLTEIATHLKNPQPGTELPLLQGQRSILVQRTVEAVPGVAYQVIGFAPLSAFDEYIRQVRDQVLLFTCIALIFSAWLAYTVAYRSARQLTALAQDSEHIQALDFSGDPKVESIFYEIDVLGAAHQTMKRSIQERTAALALARDKLQSLVESGLALASEKDQDTLLWNILMTGKRLSAADAVTLYLATDHDTLRFALRSRDDPLPSFEIPLHDPETGAPKEQFVSVYAAIHKQTVCVDDVYTDSRFDFTGARNFDAETGYRTQSMLTVPMVTIGGEVIGVLQLLNATDPASGQIVPFDPEVVRFVEALAAQGAMSLDNHALLESQRVLMDSLIEIIAGAIDAKSAYTGGHCARVPELAIMLAEEACRQEQGPFADFRFESEDQWREFRIGAWLHDCGKVTTPEYVVDKATKLETIYNRIHEIRTRFEVLLRDAEIEHLRSLLAGEEAAAAEQRLAARRAQLQDDYAFVAASNVGGEFMQDEDIARLQGIASQTWLRHFDDRLGLSQAELLRREDQAPTPLPVLETLLCNQAWHRVPRTQHERYDEKFGFKIRIPELLYDFGELTNLCIRRGTLTEEERFKINEHIIQTIIMLERLPLPARMRRIPEYAGTHHETLVGSGYPRQLTAEQLSIPARIMAIADIFEALTASDRPYKPAKTLSESIRILSFFAKDQHIDPELFKLFLRSKTYQRYAERFLLPQQIDAVDLAAYLGEEA